ncbi:hypothetical protein AW736_07855 [Termitidicoccus mucosus]|uniref:Uncharacterized protein n=1 Tax=Termitidicoccus mucosus TaxID=1184151 RepID=A0A178IKJ2_9BACT|nr:hypothetical protein AW736_07855 [Opitutaceae bacterium TSB47]
MVIGFLYWKRESIREGWRKARLQMEHGIPVKVPLHYWRKSKSKTFTMTFGPKSGGGYAIVPPCRETRMDGPKLQAEAEALWGVELIPLQS